jgi:hypothetical protein
MKIATAPTKELGNLMLFRGQDINADLANSTKADKFAKASPERFLQMGIAEQNFIGAAVGLASVGYIPWLSIFAVFFTHRAVDPIRMLIAQTHANVKLGAAYAGAWRIKELLILGSEYAGETKTGTQNLRWLFVTFQPNQTGRDCRDFFERQNKIGFAHECFWTEKEEGSHSH